MAGVHAGQSGLLAATTKANLAVSTSSMPAFGSAWYAARQGDLPQCQSPLQPTAHTMSSLRVFSMPRTGYHSNIKIARRGDQIAGRGQSANARVSYHSFLEFSLRRLYCGMSRVKCYVLCDFPSTVLTSFVEKPCAVRSHTISVSLYSHSGSFFHSLHYCVASCPSLCIQSPTLRRSYSSLAS